MSDPNNFVYDQIYKGAMAKGATERNAYDCAVRGLEDYKKGKFKKAIELIEGKISEAKRLSK